jgi:hypothetical protein
MTTSDLSLLTTGQLITLSALASTLGGIMAIFDF